MHLRYYYLEAWELGIEEHAQTQMKKLGISYTHSTPQPIGDQWWFWNCTNVPDILPSYISVLDTTEEAQRVSLGTGDGWE